MPRPVSRPTRVTRLDPATPSIMPVFPAGSVVGRQPRTAPVAWLCQDGHRHAAPSCGGH